MQMKKLDSSRLLTVSRRVLTLAALLSSAAVTGCSGELGGDGSTAEDDQNMNASEDGQDDMNPEDDSSNPDDDPTNDDAEVEDGDDGSEDGDATLDQNPPGDDPDAPDAPDTPDEVIGADPDEPYVASQSLAVRLTQAELDNTLRDILGDESSPGSQFLAEDEFSPFDNDTHRQTVSQALIDSLTVLAEDVALRAVSADRRDLWMPCTPADVTDSACFTQTIQELARMFFRRPLPDAEVDNYQALLTYAEEQGDFYAAVELLLTSFLQDPEFLYRAERGTASGTPGALELDDYEIASRISFLLLGSGPSAELLDQAGSGELTAPDTRREIAQALLQDDRAKAQLYRFHAMWLGYRTLPNSADLNAAFQRETESLIERTVFTEPQSYLQLFQSENTFVTGELAEHYGLPQPDGDENWVTYPPDSGRAGILGHGSILAAFSKFTDTSPTQRGIFVRTRLMCLDVPPPPPTVDVDQPPGAEMDAACKLDRYRAHREQSGCAECHSLFDPIGEGLENYDIQGRFRETDDDNPDCTINPNGELPGFGNFNGPEQLSDLLVDNDLITDCLIDHYLQFALAKGPLTPQEQTYAGELAAGFVDDDHRLDEFLLNFVASEAFALRLEENQ